MSAITLRQMRDRCIQHEVCRRDMDEARNLSIAIVAATLVFGLALVASAVAGAI